MSKLTDMLTRHERTELKPYTDTEGKTTIGTGRNLTDRGISPAEAAFLLMNDLAWVQAEITRFSFWPGLDPVRQDALLDMYFNLGAKRFLGFSKMIAALNVHDWETAASEMLSSAWAAQVKGRAVELSAMIRTGEYQA